jgi:hypothetical protein
MKNVQKGGGKFKYEKQYHVYKVDPPFEKVKGQSRGWPQNKNESQ